MAELRLTAVGLAGLAALAAVGSFAAPVDAQSTPAVQVVSVDATDYPDVSIDVALPEVVAARGPGAGAFRVAGGTVKAAVRLDPRLLTVGLVIDDSRGVPLQTATAETGAALELVRGLDRGTYAVFAAASGAHAGPSSNLAAVAAGFRQIGRRPVADPTAFGRMTQSVASRLGVPGRRGALVILATDRSGMSAADAASVGRALAARHVRAQIVVLGTRVQPGLSALAKATGGTAVAVPPALYLRTVDAVTGSLTDQYRLGLELQGGGPRLLRVTVGRQSFVATVPIPASPTTIAAAPVPPSAAPSTASAPTSAAVPAPTSAATGSTGVAGVVSRGGRDKKVLVAAVAAIVLALVVGGAGLVMLRRSRRGRRRPLPATERAAEAAEPLRPPDPELRQMKPSGVGPAAIAAMTSEDADEVAAVHEMDDMHEVDDMDEAAAVHEVAAVTAPDFEDDDLPDPATLYDLDLPDRAVWDADDEPDAPTLGDWFEEWWSTRPPGRPAERTRDERLARTQILPEWGAVPLSELSAGALQSWVTHMAGPSGGRLPSVEVRRTIQLLDGCLEAAVEEALVTENPASHVALPASDARPRRVLTDDELWRLAGAMDRPYRAFVLLAGFCGLRLGELLALRWSAIDIADARVDITETLLDGGGVLRIERPRSNAAIRSIRLPSFVAAELERKAELGVDPDQLVFPSAEGHLLRPTAFRRSFWLPAVHDAGLAPLGIHDLRPTAVAIWISEGATPEQVAKLAGHSSPAVVVELYGDLFPDGDERLLAALERRESGRAVASG